MIVTALERPPANRRGSPYVCNRAPLAVNPLVKLPIGAIEPRGWLAGQLERLAAGMVGHLPEVSRFCRGRSGWLDPVRKSWEEVPYWLRGLVDLGYVLGDERVIGESRRWLDAILDGQDADGWLGPRPLRETHDAWPNMIVLFALRSDYEATGTPRVLDALLRYFRYRHGLGDAELFPARWGVGRYRLPWWQHVRAGDELDSVYWLYNRSGATWLLDLARRLAEHGAAWRDKVQSWHGVNICQGFRNPALYYQQARDPALLAATRRRLAEVYARFGQVPGGMFGADEDCREGFFGPRQGAETCSMVELMHSCEMLLKITGESDWPDLLEEVAFNSLPAAMTPDGRALHYLTCPNVVQLDRGSKAPGVENGGNTLAFDPWDHRCCQHNVGMGWPYLAEHLWCSTQDAGLAAVVYAPCRVRAKVGGDVEVTIDEETDYPFDETVTLVVGTPRPVEFALYLRVPGWCAKPRVEVNGREAEVAAASRGGAWLPWLYGAQESPGWSGRGARDPAGRDGVPPADDDGASRGRGYMVLRRTWRAGDRVRIEFPAEVRLVRWKSHGDCVSVRRGALVYALKIAERWRRMREGPGEDYETWPGWEVLPASPWNFGLWLPAQADPRELFAFRRKPGALADQPFAPDSAPLELRARGVRIPQWQQDGTGLVDEVQPSPVRVDDVEPEPITLIPMGCGRLRISAFPTVRPDGAGHEWTLPPRCLHEASCVGGELGAVSNGLWPWAGVDAAALPRFTWLPRRGSVEWITYKLRPRRRVSQTHIYWVEDDDCQPPAAWRLYWRRTGGPWRRTVDHGRAIAERAGWDTRAFDAVVADEIKLEVELRPGRSAGIYEWIFGPQNPA